MDPHKYASNNIQGAVSEIMSALSSLAMEPQEREHQPDEIFLRDIDHWAHHACEHLYQAVDFLGRESQQAPPLDGMSIYDVERLLKDIRVHLLFTLEGGLNLKRAAAEIELAICTLEGASDGSTRISKD